jgi:hypothetical protein
MTTFRFIIFIWYTTVIKIEALFKYAILKLAYFEHSDWFDESVCVCVGDLSSDPLNILFEEVIRVGRRRQVMEHFIAQIRFLRGEWGEELSIAQVRNNETN